MSNHPYVTYYNSPMQIGTGIDNISTKDAGDVVLTQSVNFVATGAGTQTIQLPLGAQVLGLYADNLSGTALSAGSIDIQAAGASLLNGGSGGNPGPIGLIVTGVRTTLTTTYSGALVLRSISAGNQVLSVVLAGAQTSPGSPSVGVTLTYKMAVNP
jgi:hypothetical protein